MIKIRTYPVEAAKARAKLSENRATSAMMNAMTLLSKPTIYCYLMYYDMRHQFLSFFALKLTYNSTQKKITTATNEIMSSKCKSFLTKSKIYYFHWITIADVFIDRSHSIPFTVNSNHIQIKLTR